MSDSAEETKKHIKTYWTIGAALMVLTLVTVAISYVEFAVPLTITVALIIAATKGSLVMTYFMHLIGERKGIHATLLLTAFFFLVLMFLPLLSHTDRIGEYMTLPNANTATADVQHEVDGH
jgi:caa(3)-type oxidase subunit IV